jgi:hypothetical protein
MRDGKISWKVFLKNQNPKKKQSYLIQETCHCCGHWEKDQNIATQKQTGRVIPPHK